MSANILEQAIIDAKALREAALKNAETSILEKYSAEVRGAIDVMLEAEMEEGSIMEHEMMSPEEESASAPLAAAEGEDLCGCPDQDETVEWELSLNDLTAMSEEMDEGMPMPQEDLAEEFGAEPMEEEDKLTLQESELDEAHCGGMHEDAEELDEEIDLVFEEEEEDEPSGEAGSSRRDRMRDRHSKKVPRALEEEELKVADGPGKGKENMGITKDGKMVPNPMEEEIDLDEEMVREIVEELVVDIKPTKSGYAGTPEPIVRHQEEQELTRLQGTEVREENDALVAAAKELSEAKKVVETEKRKAKTINLRFGWTAQRVNPFKRKTTLHESDIDECLPE